MIDRQKGKGRRSFIKDLARLGALGGMTLSGTTLTQAAWSASQAESNATKRLAIVGGGMGGIASAWFCDGEWAIDLFESRSKVGGHGDTVQVKLEDKIINADLGAQFFHPDTHPLYVSLLEELGLFSETAPNSDQTVEVPGSLSILSLDDGRYFFNSKYPGWSILTAINFAIYSQNARDFILKNGSYEITLENWIAGLPLTNSFKNQLLLPWMSAMIGTTIENARRSSARAILQTFALAYPENICKGATTMNSKIGIGGNLQAIMNQCQSTNVWLNAGINKLTNEFGKWYVHTEAGPLGPYDQIIVNAPPHASRNWFDEVPFATDIVTTLNQFEYFKVQMAIHTDPIYVVESPSYWCAYNAGIKGKSCEGSVWLGAFHDEIPGPTKSLFKSWVTARTNKPKNILFQREFLHPLITPQVIRASRSIRKWQGYEGLWFAGQYTTGMDLQEAALYSAWQIGKQLNPNGAHLAALANRLILRGKTQINYDL